MNILWDFDGTLVDSYHLFVSLFKEVLGRHVSEREILSHLKVSFSHTVKHYNLSDEKINRIRSMENNLLPSDYKPFDGLENILTKADHNFIVTHNSKKVIQRVLTHYSLANYFTKIIAKEDPFPRKPDLLAYQHILKDYTIDLVIGDRELDLIPGKMLGIPTCSFQNENYTEADYYVQSYEELDQYLSLNQ